MKAKFTFMVLLFVVFVISNNNLVFAFVFNYPDADSSQAEKVYYAVEINNVLCGYFEAEESSVELDGNNYTQQDVTVFAMLSALGSEFNQKVNIHSLVEPVSRRCKYINTIIDQGTGKFTFELSIENNIAKITSSIGGEPKEIEITPDVLTGNDEVFQKMRHDIFEKNMIEVNYNILEMMAQEVQQSTFRKIGEEKLELAGKEYNTTIIEQTNNKTGIKIKYWVMPDLDFFLKMETMNRKLYLADRSVIDQIKVANMDASLFTKTNVAISDIHAISYMKLKIKIEPTGVALKQDDLTIPGQKFEGTINDNVIEGVLEIEHKKYDGYNAPAFPTDYSANESLQKYLLPDSFIESNDPILIKTAKEITEGSKDSWEAAKRLSKWVAENIGYAIPGGGTARKTYDIRAGECGAHSMLLTALCRAVGIPARIAFGAMYAPNYGGGFGQHAWNEIYMGDAGWIPVDATAHEIDFVDSGHIRITELISLIGNNFNGKEIEVIDYKLGDKTRDSIAEEKNNYEPYLGKFTNPTDGGTFTILVKEGNLSVDIPGKMVLPFNDEDAEGKWICKIAPQIFLQFSKDEKGIINKMDFHQIVSVPKKSDPETIEENVPGEFIPYLGNYYFAAINNNLTVTIEDGSLAVIDPTERETIKLQNPREDGGWIDQYNKNIVYFEKDVDGIVTGMKIDVVNKFTRGELAADIIDKIIETDGLDAGQKKYEEIKMENNAEIIFTERSFNLLGYKYINFGKLIEAIEILKFNVTAYPESFNAYDSLGEAYMKNNQNELAIENYKKSLELNPQNENAAKMLEKLSK
ncbi:MAG: transglutaminase domain-containing protein [bacterium]